MTCIFNDKMHVLLAVAKVFHYFKVTEKTVQITVQLERLSTYRSLRWPINDDKSGNTYLQTSETIFVRDKVFVREISLFSRLLNYTQQLLMIFSSKQMTYSLPCRFAKFAGVRFIEKLSHIRRVARGQTIGAVCMRDKE